MREKKDTVYALQRDTKLSDIQEIKAAAMDRRTCSSSSSLLPKFSSSECFSSAIVLTKFLSISFTISVNRLKQSGHCPGNQEKIMESVTGENRGGIWKEKKKVREFKQVVGT